MDKKDTLDLLRSLLISKKGTYELRELLRDFRNEAGYSLPSFGYKTHLDFLKSVPDVLQLTNFQQNVIVKPVQSPKSSHISSLIKRQNTARRGHMAYPKYRSEVVWNDITHTKTGNPSDEMPRMNDEKWNNEKWSEHANNSIKITSSDSLSNKSSSPKISKTMELNNKEHELQINNEKCSNLNEIIVKRMGVGVEENLINVNVVKNFNDIPKINLKCFAKIGEYIEVCVQAIWSPYNFTLQLRRFKIKLLNLMTEMQLFYNQNGNNYRIPDSEIKGGLLCAALCKINASYSQWYRAIILERSDKNSVAIGIIDYGAVVAIGVDSIRFLHRRFDKLPPQAISGHLANIQPAGSNDWSEESTERFCNLVFEKELVAGIVDLDYEENWLSLALSLTDGPEIHISDTLVEEGFAVFSSCDSASHFGLPWIENVGNHSLSNPVPNFWFHSRQYGQILNSRTENKKCSESVGNQLFFSYSDSNVRLLEMFVN